MAKINGNNSNNTLNGTNQNDVINGLAGNDTLNGKGGDDTFTGGTGNDIFNGGAGFDDTVQETGNVNFVVTDTKLTGLGTDSLNNIEEVDLTGGNGDNLLNASAFSGRIELSGGAGNDILIGSSDGGNFFTGGTGNDTIIGGAIFNDTVKETGNVNFVVTDTKLTGLGTDSLNNIEEVDLTGGNGDNLLNASAFSGRIELSGGAGNDTLIGNNPASNFIANNFTGGTGDDTIIGGIDSFDLVVETGNVNFVLTNTKLTGLGTDSLSSIEQAQLTGGSGNNVLDASGFSGQADLFGLDGNDTYRIGRNAIDNIIEDANPGIDTVESEINFTLDANLENLTLFGSSNINGTGNELNNKITGNNFNNTLDGGEGNDTLLGGDGNDILLGGDGNDDVLVGGFGNDRLTGGVGSNHFRYNAANEGIDTITDFVSPFSSIEVKASGFGGGLKAGTLSADQFVIGSAAQDANDRFIFDNRSAGDETLLFDRDGTGSASAVIIAGFSRTSATNLSASDIIVF